MQVGYIQMPCWFRKTLKWCKCFGHLLHLWDKRMTKTHLLSADCSVVTWSSPAQHWQSAFNWLPRRLSASSPGCIRTGVCPDNELALLARRNRSFVRSFVLSLLRLLTWLTTTTTTTVDRPIHSTTQPAWDRAERPSERASAEVDRSDLNRIRLVSAACVDLQSSHRRPLCPSVRWNIAAALLSAVSLRADDRSFHATPQS